MGSRPIDWPPMDESPDFYAHGPYVSREKSLLLAVDEIGCEKGLTAHVRNYMIRMGERYEYI